MFRELVNKLGVVHSCGLSHTPIRRCGAGLREAEESGDDGGRKGHVWGAPRVALSRGTLGVVPGGADALDSLRGGAYPGFPV